jgi:hypothetical protein
VNWQRRPTQTEVSAVIETETERRTELLILADPQLPRPQFGPLPTGDGMTRAVYACAEHAISLDGAAHLHESNCTAPNEADLPGCNCTPAAPEQEAAEPASSVQLPDHWITG